MSKRRSEVTRAVENAAKQILAPLGLRQKGRSQTWLDDRGWWVGVVEFQPSGFSGASYLNVGVNWLWTPKSHLSFDYGYREPGFSKETDANLPTEVETMARHAAQRVLEYRELFPDPWFAADILLRDPPPMRAIDGAIAAGLAGDAPRARQAFDIYLRVRHRAEDPEWVRKRRRRVEALRASVADEQVFKHEIREDIQQARTLLNLPAVADLPF